MDRRFLTWLMLSTAFFFLYLSMRPQVPPPGADQQAENEVVSDDPLLQGPTPGNDQDPDADPAASQDGGKPAFPLRHITLGSMDPEQGYNLLITFTSQGAGIEQAELIGRRENSKLMFRALEHTGGYLGYLSLVKSEEGMAIRTIPDGSPAALATSTDAAGGLQVGDVLKELNQQSIDSQEALLAALANTKPGDVVELRVTRSTNDDQQSLVYQATLSEAPLDILRTKERASEQVTGNRARPSLRTTLGSLETTRIPPGQSSLPALRETLTTNWELRELDVPGGQGVEFRLPLSSFLASTGRPSKLELVKRYRLFPAAENQDGYSLDLETVVVNQNDEEVTTSFRQEGLSGLTLEGWWYSVKISPYMFSGAGQRDAIYNSLLASHQLVTTRQIQDYAKKNGTQPDKLILSENETAEARSLRYIGLDSQYFNASVLPHPDQPASLANLRQAAAEAVADVNQIQKSQAQATNSSFWFDTTEQLIPPGGEISQRYQVFIGPKDSNVLAAHGLSRSIEYGWFPWIAKPLSAILHFFHGIVRNYGLAIVLLTVMVRGSMFPLGRKAAMNAQRMQELQPEMKKIQEKYKDNMEQRAKAMQELYTKHNFKPLAGCLPMFIQLPIFIGLYRCLSVDISLRQEPLIPGLSWCSNLAGPDMLIDWSGWMPEFIAGRGVGWLGPYFNILPMVTVALFLLQQQMLMPKATDDQTRMTQNMMKVMTCFMGVLFFKVPSGLCIYFITSSLWSLVERKLVKRFTPKSDGPSSPGITTTNSPSDNPSIKGGSRRDRGRSTGTETKKTGRMQELMDMLEKPAVKSSTQRSSPQKGPPKQNRNRKKDKKRKR